MRANLSADTLRALLNYDKGTGVFTWATDRPGQPPAGSAAGFVDPKGYVRIRVNKRSYRAHRLAWLWVHGDWPSRQIDHVNGVKSDNSLSNLREASAGENKQNLRQAQSNSKSGILGVVWNEQTKRWRAFIRVEGKQKFLGGFLTAEEAKLAYLDAKAKYHPFQTIAENSNE